MHHFDLFSGTEPPPLRETITLEQALRGCHTTLGDLYAHVPLRPTTPKLLDLLGGALLIAAEQCLPGPTRVRDVSIADDARSWPRLGATEQLKLLEIFVSMLVQPPPWRNRTEVPSQFKPFLPKEMGPWEGDSDWTSCFGVQKLVASYGRLTGASMLAASVQHMGSELPTRAFKAMFGEAYNVVRHVLPEGCRLDRLPEYLLAGMRGAEKVLHMCQQFHGAIVIRLADGRWICADPYQYVLYPLDQSLDEVAKDLTKHPDKALLFLDRTDWKERVDFERGLRAIRGILESTSTNLHDGLSPWQLVEALEARLAEHACPRLAADELLAGAVALTKDSDPDHIRHMVALQNTTNRRGLRERILLGAFQAWASALWDEVDRKSMGPHRSMILSAVPRTLAAETLVILRHRMPNPPILGADLLRYAGSDVVLRNGFLDAARGCATTEEKAVLEKRLATYRNAPPHMLHTLIREIL